MRLRHVVLVALGMLVARAGWWWGREIQAVRRADRERAELDAHWALRARAQKPWAAGTFRVK